MESSARRVGAAALAVGLVLVGFGVVATDRGREINWVPVGATTRTLTTQQIAHIESLDIGPRPSTVAFGGDIGSFRMVGYTSATTTSYTGLPVSAITDTTRQLIGLVSAGTLLGLVFVGTGGTFLVRRNLEPLRRVAGVARPPPGPARPAQCVSHQW